MSWRAPTEQEASVKVDDAGGQCRHAAQRPPGNRWKPFVLRAGWQRAPTGPEAPDEFEDAGRASVDTVLKHAAALRACPSGEAAERGCEKWQDWAYVATSAITPRPKGRGLLAKGGDKVRRYCVAECVDSQANVVVLRRELSCERNTFLPLIRHHHRPPPYHIPHHVNRLQHR